MISSNSTWDRERSVKYRSPSFIYGGGKVTFEFGNRRSEKIFESKLGRVTFSPGSGADRQSGRDEQIRKLYGERSVDGYTYRSISHVHVLPELMDEDMIVYGHGSPAKGGWENCTTIQAECKEGYGTDSRCEVGKCGMGRLTRVAGEKWRYDSFTVPDLYYFVFGRDKVTLRSVVRGRFTLPGGTGVVEVPHVASIPAEIYLPPNTYSEETFVRRVIKSESLTDSVDNFIRSLIGRNQATVKVEKELYDRVLDSIQSSLDPFWSGFVLEAINKAWSSKYDKGGVTNRDFLIECYTLLSDLYRSGIQIVMSGIRGSRLTIDSGIGRPVYGRLPGIEGRYNDGEGGETVGKWLTSGADENLSRSKSLIDNFYRYFLDPQTCYPLNLDWLGQHMGFMGGLWNTDWPVETKRRVLASSHVNGSPESGSWTRDPEEDTLRQIDFSRIERVSVEGNNVTVSGKYFGKQYDGESDTTSVVSIPELVIDSSGWQGILPSRGGMVTLLFMLYTLGIKSHNPSELVYNDSDNTFNVRSGMRSLEVSSPVLTPYTVDVLRAGSETDSEIGNYSNQLIADVGTCQDELSANTIVFRMPFYYNRNGRSWDATKQIVDNYVPATAISKLQYAYAASDLLVAEDVFFEPEIDD